MVTTFYYLVFVSPAGFLWRVKRTKNWKWQRVLVHFLLLSFLLGAAYPACASKNQPLKLAVKSEQQDFWTGDQVWLVVFVLDANNDPAPAQREWAILLDIRSPLGEIQTENVYIKKGSASKGFNFEVEHPGIYEIQAAHDELLDGGLFLNVKIKKPASERDDPTRSSHGANLIDLLGQAVGPPVKVLFRSAPRRTLLADGNDSGKILAMVTGDDAIAPQDIHIKLHNDEGLLNPSVILVKKGQFSGEAELSSDHAGQVKIEYISSVPTIEVVGDKELAIDFRPPITQLELKPSPPRISLFDKAELIARLLDSNGAALATNQARKISFSLEMGRAELEAGELIIPAGGFDGRLELQPTQTGEVVVVATSPDLHSIRATILVEWPMALLALSGLGGVTGGFLAFLVGQEKKWWLCVVGLVTGFVMYWAVIFGGLDLIPRGFVLNPLSAFVISVLGGWLGTKVFSVLLKQFGFES